MQSSQTVSQYFFVSRNDMRFCHCEERLARRGNLKKIFLPQFVLSVVKRVEVRDLKGYDIRNVFFYLLRNLGLRLLIPTHRDSK